LHIQCAVCKLMVQEAGRQAKVQDLKESDEDAYADIIDHLCTVKQKQGRWVSSIDISEPEDGDGQLQIEKKPDVGECKTECHLARAACLKALKGNEEALQSLLRSGLELEEISGRVCKKTCKSLELPDLEDWIDEPFVPRDPASVQQEDMLPPGMRAYDANDIVSMSEGDAKAFSADQERERMRRAWGTSVTKPAHEL